MQQQCLPTYLYGCWAISAGLVVGLSDAFAKSTHSQRVRKGSIQNAGCLLRAHLSLLSSTGGLGRDDEFAGLADAEIVAQDGSKLPVHSQVVSIHSRVLKGLFAAVRDGCTSGAADEAVSLKDCFISFSLYSVAAFLRFCYQPEDACKENFKQLDDEICSVVRLAHQLDCPQLQSKLEEYLSNTVDCLDVKGAVCWARLAEDCKLNKLRVQALRQAALALIKPPGGFNTPNGYGANSQAAASSASAVASTSAL